VQPGQTFESKVIELAMMSEGAWRGSATLDIDGQSVATVPLQQTANSSAEAPPRDLRLTRTFTEVSADGVRVPTVTYETKITNQGSTPITDVKITERADNATLLGTDPVPSDRNDALGLVTWDLTSFNADTLIPGESLILHATYGPLDDGCSSMIAGIVVEADVGGTTERYGVGPDESPLVGNCPDSPQRPTLSESDMWVLRHDGVLPEDSASFGFAQAGDGPAARTFDFIWAAALLAVGGAGLVAVALVARRRVRR
jgi:hypothetical protein